MKVYSLSSQLNSLSYKVVVFDDEVSERDEQGKKTEVNGLLNKVLKLKRMC